MLLFATLLLTALLCLGAALVPDRLACRAFAPRQLLPGVLVWALLWGAAFLAFSKQGLTVGFDGFLLIVLCAAAGWVSACVLGARLLPLARGRLHRPAVAALLALIALGSEVFVFNMNYFVTHSYQPFQLFDYLVPDKDQVYDINGIQLETAHPTIHFYNIDQPIYNLQIDSASYQRLKEPSQHQDPRLQLEISASDEANSTEIAGGRWWYTPGAPRTRWVTLDFSGKISSLSLHANNYSENEWADYNWAIQGITANTPRPMDFSLLRCGLVFLALGLGWSFRPGSSLWRAKYLAEPGRWRPAVAAFALTLSLLACAAPFALPSYSGIATATYNVDSWDGESPLNFVYHFEDGTAYGQMGALAHSLLNGRLDLNLVLEPPAELVAMENPYDTELRAQTVDGSVWDAAYYDGKYYCYFGVVPCLLFQLPFEALTGIPDLPTSFGMVVMAVAAVLAGFGLVRQAAKRWFPGVSTAAYLLASTAVAGCGQLYYLLLRPLIYEYVILCGASFVMLALWQWLAASNTPDSRRGARIAHLVLGSVCMALVAGCRPQMEIFAFLALPIFWRQYVTEKRLFTRKGAAEFALFALPFVLVAAGLMWYNYARFGSPFDFGANYNLTSNDMTKRGFNAGRIGTALFYYLLVPNPLSSTFPYVGAIYPATSYVGRFIAEACYGGILATTPFLWILALAPLLRRRLAGKRLRGVVGWIVLSSVVLAVLDAEMAGILYRYLMDFALPLTFAAALCWLAAEEATRSHAALPGMAGVQTTLRVCMGLASAAGLLFAAGVFFSAEPHLHMNVPTLFDTASRLVQFWL